MMKSSWIAGAILMGACASPTPQTKTQTTTTTSAVATPTQQAQPVAVAPKWVYPATRAEAVKDTLFGVEVADPFRWLEDVKAPEVQDWMRAQDAMTRAELAKFTGREALRERLKQLLYVDAVNLPFRRGSRYFYSRNHADREKAVWYVREGLDGKERMLIDPNTMSADGSVSIGLVSPSWDGKKLAFSKKQNNSDESTMYILDVDKGVESTVDVLPGAKYADPQWTPKSDAFYYTFLPPLPTSMAIADRPGTTQIRFHKLGTNAANDPVIREATGNPKTFLGVHLSRDGKLLLVRIGHGWVSTDWYAKDLTKKGAPFVAVVEGKPFRYELDTSDGKVFVYTNEDAPRYRVFVADGKHLDRKSWKEIVTETTDTLTGVELVKGALVLSYLHDATSLIAIHDLAGKKLRTQELPGLGAITSLSGNEVDDELFYTFQSFVTPRGVYRTTVHDPKTTLWGGANLKLDASQFTTEQVWYPSKDGTKISMFVVTKKGAARDGKTPFLLTGYGGFNISRTPAFLGPQIAWLESGGGFALPNLRGGGEYGEAWHKAGMLDQKQNVFDDFVGAAEFLIKEKYTAADRLAISGRSNGGLLVGAAMTQRPDLFRVVICGVPLLDMVRYHLFGSGKTWAPEYGSAETEGGFKTLFAYSPYHHVADKTKYPALLMLGADSDDRVDPMHARKMVALVQARSTSDLPALLRVEKNSGHGGADLVKQTIEMELDIFAFLSAQLAR